LNSLITRCSLTCTGRHRCTQCTYTVERQHILDYHIKIVHSGSSATTSDRSTSDAAITPSRCSITTSQPDVPDSNASEHATDSDHQPSPHTVSNLNGVLESEPSILTAVDGADYTGSSFLAVDGPTSIESSRPRAGLGVGRSCIRCGFVGGTDGSAARHRLVGHSGLEHRCGNGGVCDRRTTTLRIMATHRARAHPVRQASTESKSTVGGSASGIYTCRECPYRSSSPSHVASHGRLHAPPDRNHRCPDCSYSVDRRSLLGQHQRLHQQLVDEKRQRQDSQTVMPSVAEEPKQCDVIVRRLRCPHCPFRCRTAGQLSIHGRHHDNEDNLAKSVSSTSGRRYKCDRCSFSVDVLNALEHHRKLHRKQSSTCQRR